MYVTKQNMANAVTNLTKHLDHVSDALAVSISYFLIGIYWTYIFFSLVPALVWWTASWSLLCLLYASMGIDDSMMIGKARVVIYYMPLRFNVF